MCHFQGKKRCRKTALGDDDDDTDAILNAKDVTKSMEKHHNVVNDVRTSSDGVEKMTRIIKLDAKHNGNNFVTFGQWFWLSWQCGCFWIRRSVVLI